MVRCRSARSAGRCVVATRPLLNLLRVALRNMQDTGRMAEWEKAVGADWIHPVPNYVPTSNMVAVS